MKNNMNRRTALVTGSSSGIGRAVALKLAHEGFNMVINHVSESTKVAAEEVAKECRELGVEAIIQQCDVTSFEQTELMVKNVIKEFGTIDVLVNNAGVERDNLMLRMDEKSFDFVVDVNLKGTWNMMKQCTRQMLKQRYGRIINISSVIGIMGNAGQVNYAASKAGVIGMTKSMAKELSSRGITTNAVAPGFIKTPMTDELTQEQKDAIIAQIPSGQLGEPEDVANAVAFLASDEAKYINGHVLTVSGGLAM